VALVAGPALAALGAGTLTTGGIIGGGLYMGMVPMDRWNWEDFGLAVGFGVLTAGMGEMLLGPGGETPPPRGQGEPPVEPVQEAPPPEEPPPPEGPQKTPTDLYAFGNKTAPRPPRVEGVNTKPGQTPDLITDENGNIIPQEDPPGWPKGASTFSDPAKAPVGGHYHKLPAGTELPEGFGVKADGSEVGGPQPEGHHTIYPTEPMPGQDFVDQFNGLPWEYAGKK
jgi:hypothetical protein